MSEKQEHKRRYNLRLQYIAEFEKWLKEEPPVVLFWKWRSWKRRRPVWEEIKQEDREMTTEEAILRIRDHIAVHGIGQYPHIKLAEALDMATDALRAQQERENPKPLTLRELLWMSGEPVFVHYMGGCVGHLGWMIVDRVDIPGETLYCEGHEPLRNYGKGCVAYRCMPQTIGNRIRPREEV